MRARSTVLVVGALVVVLLASVLPAGAAGRGTRVFVRTAIDGGDLAVRPEAIALSVHGSLSLYRLRWRDWGGEVARASGRARVKACVPDCNLGKVEWPRATVRLEDRIRCEGRIVYGWLGYRLHGEIPEGVKPRGSVDMRPRGC